MPSPALPSRVELQHVGGERTQRGAWETLLCGLLNRGLVAKQSNMKLSLVLLSAGLFHGLLLWAQKGRGAPQALLTDTALV